MDFSVKARLRRIADSLPDDATWEDALKCIVAVRATDEAFDYFEAGEELPQAVLRQLGVDH